MALRRKVDGAWVDVTYAEVGEVVSEIGRGLIDLGLAPRRSHRDPLHDAARVDLRRLRRSPRPGSPSSRSTPRTPRRSASGSSATPSRGPSSARTPSRSRRSSRSASGSPQLEHIVVIDPSPETRGRGRDPARRAARARPPARQGRARRPHGGGAARATPTRSSTRRARPARPRAACSATATTAPCSTWCRPAAAASGPTTTSIYLFLPLAHAFALLLQLGSFDVGATIAYWGGDPKQIIAELSEVQPTYLPSVPRIFEKLYTLVTAHGDAGARSPRPRRRAWRSARLQAAGEPVPAGPAGRVRPRGRGAVQERPRGRSAGGCARPSPARRRSRRTSSSSSTPAASRSWRATG